MLQVGRGRAGQPPPGPAGVDSRSCDPAGGGSSPGAGARAARRQTMAALLKSLLAASEKAACIAQLCRQEEALFSLLIEEKRGADKNKKFLQDFKTLADVLIQEVIKHDVGQKFPELQDHIRGEESNKFENGLGETVVVQVCPTQQETAALLEKVLDRKQAAAELLAAAIHQEVVLSDPALDDVAVTISTESMAVWIDPIDSTNQYIRGRGDVLPVDGIYPSGLRSALVLIGVYNRHSGEPVLGIINEPFFKEKLPARRWQSKYHWGISYGGTRLSSLSRPQLRTSPRVVLSSNEKVALQEALTPLYGQQLCFASGAGYKMLCVALGLADAYVLSEGSTFKWDSCGPHAILLALGGGMVDLSEALKSWQAGQRKPLPELTYNKPVEGALGAERWANQGGLVAYIHREHLEAVMATLAAAANTF
ncbi:inositol polyphosphate 1-phosphatase isoform X1 [Podarcis muralis]